MRTTVDLPDTLFRKTKATAALRGSTMNELIVHAIEKEIETTPANKKGKPVSFPLVKMPKGKRRRTARAGSVGPNFWTDEF